MIFIINFVGMNVEFFSLRDWYGDKWLNVVMGITTIMLPIQPLGLIIDISIGPTRPSLETEWSQYGEPVCSIVGVGISIGPIQSSLETDLYLANLVQPGDWVISIWPI